jgi:hypothetical protein
MTGMAPSIALHRGATLPGMGTETATIRVPRATRDLLAQRARERGMSLSALLTELAHGVTREAAFAAEREAARADASNPQATREQGEWEGTLGDGID